MLVVLSQQNIAIVDSSVSGFEEMIQRIKITATGMNVCSAWDNDWNIVLFLGHSWHIAPLCTMVGL